MTEELHGEDAQLAGLQDAADATREGNAPMRFQFTLGGFLGLLATRLSNGTTGHERTCAACAANVCGAHQPVGAVLQLLSEAVTGLEAALAKQHESTAFYKQQFNHERTEVRRLAKLVEELSAPVPLILACPECDVQHVDEGEWATRRHGIHRCSACGHEWSPAARATVGVRMLQTTECTVPSGPVL